MKPSIFRPLQFVIFAFLTLIVVGLVVSVGLTWREERQLAAAQTQIDRVYRFERVQLLVARNLEALTDDVFENDPTPTDVTNEIDELKQLCLDPSTPPKLEEFRTQALPAVTAHRAPSYNVFILLHEITLIERAGHAGLFASLRQQAATQRRLELAAPLAILAVGILLLPIARRRIIAPLNAFGRQLSRLAAGDFTPAPVEDVDPLILPLHRQFNDLTRRLAELEAAHEARARSLEEEVRAATRTLLEQQRSLARAERLAATGELAASVAHELRNPLAGVQMTLANLRSELHDAELVERLDLVLHEVDRLTRLLNQLLDTARHAPEAARPLHLAESVDEMLGLLRYQVAPNVRVDNRIDPQLTCRLPPDRLRQALLNLVLNSASAVAPSGGTVQIEAVREGARLQIRVTDDGPGFPEETLRAGIRPFLSTHEHGTGLGLAMVRRFARDLGGEVTLANREPHGACVTMHLPVETDQI
jgi:signal transduction histidine kinase